MFRFVDGKAVISVIAVAEKFADKIVTNVNEGLPWFHTMYICNQIQNLMEVQATIEEPDFWMRFCGVIIG